MLKKTIFLIGAGGHARSLINLLEQNGFKIIGIFDNTYRKEETEYISDYRLIGSETDILGEKRLVLAVGDNRNRQDYLEKYKKQVEPINLIHPSAIVESKAVLGKYNQIFARTYFNAEVEVEDNNIINTGAILEHEVKVGSHNHISVGTILCGRVKVGDRCFIGAGTVVKDKVTICSDVVVGANSVVITDIVEPGIYVGCPVRRLYKK